MNHYTQGAPGIFIAPEERPRTLVGARMDVCAFVGAAPRGPVRPLRLRTSWWVPEPDEDRTARVAMPVAVESLAAYRHLYGEGGPGLLGRAVQSFFEQGGLRAYIVRIVPGDESFEDAAPPATAVGRLRSESSKDTGAVALRARNEGAWGNLLRAELSFAARRLDLRRVDEGSFEVDAGSVVIAGDLLRLSWSNGIRTLTFVQSVESGWLATTGERRLLARVTDAGPSDPERVEVVQASLTVGDRDGRFEVHEGLGCSSLHPRWLAKVLFLESTLVYPDPAWADGNLELSDAALPSWLTDPFARGIDRWSDITEADLFGNRTDPPFRQTDGLYCIAALTDVASLCVPDLFCSAVSPISSEPHPAALGASGFEKCWVPPPALESPEPVPPALTGLTLDPHSELDRVVARQQRLVQFAADQQSFVALLDVPPGLTASEMFRWRQRFSSPYASAYHPWLRVADAQNRLVTVNPSAIAAGIIAQRELAEGIPRGPANVLALGVVGVEDEVSPGLHDELHAMAINAFIRDRDGFRLMGARTLSADAAYRQLSVRRLVTMLRRTIDQQMQWAVFEPNDAGLRADITFMLRSYLRALYRANAFRGATEDEAFFVRCDDALNPRWTVDAGQLIAEVGVAPAEPMEFVVLRIARDRAGTLEIAS